MQPFVKKCFEAVQSLTFDSNLMITGCTSIEGENIDYDTPVDPNGETNGVEKWLLQVRCQLASEPQHFNILRSSYTVDSAVSQLYGCNVPLCLTYPASLLFSLVAKWSSFVMCMVPFSC